MKAVEFINVTFSYEGSGAAVLDTASFCAEYNQLTVLAGFSGAGKSTVLSLIAGIIPNEVSGNMCGEILIAGENVRGKQLRGL
ncbi:MAG TPA: ABC transporter ATP-binding protein, partial [Treponema sp.]|nr:ABC transporter ATP-binding protein [Treponema sp.]